ncbi:MAG: arylsulfatase, partial [Opitutaceae bacterium]
RRPPSRCSAIVRLISSGETPEPAGGPPALPGSQRPRHLNKSQLTTAARWLRRSLTAALVAGLLPAAQPSRARATEPPPRPNIVFILADDLGYGETGFNGARFASTPNLDRLAAEGIRFTRHYAGSAVCAPSRCTLLTGLHTGHCQIRDNVAIGADGEEFRPALQPEDVTVAGILRDAGYITGCIGKWGLGDEGTTGVPWKQGFDHFFGYLHNTHGTRYFTEFIYRNESKIALPGNYGNWRTQYGPDLCLEEAERFLEEHRDRPFFLYYAFNLVHGQYIDPPPDANLPPVETPPGVDFTDQQRTYFAMIQRLDRDVGRLVAQIDALRLTEKTLIIFASDNGSKGIGQGNDALINASGGLRGGKADLYEGGIRVPFAARWPGVIAEGAHTGHAAAFWDFPPTVCELTGASPPPGLDGISYLPALLGRPQASHEYLYWELAKRDEPTVVPRQAVSRGRWKAVRNGDNPPELYDLDSDPAETVNLAGRHPAVLAELLALMERARVADPHFPLQAGPGFE